MFYRSQLQAVVGWICAAIMVALAPVAVADPTARHHGGYVLAVILLLIAVGMVRAARCGVRASATGVRIVNLRGSIDLPWERIDAFELSPYGASRVALKDGRRILLTGIEQSNWAFMTNKRDTQERYMIDELNRLLHKHAAGDRAPTAHEE